MTAPAVQPLPRERAPGQYEVQNEQRYRQQVDEELQQKHDRRSHLRLGRGKFLILSAPEGLEYQIGLTNGGLLTVTNNTTGAAGEFVVDWDTINGAAARDAQILALETSVDGIPGIYATISALASVESTAAGARATLETNLTAAYQAADATLQTQINNRATITQLNTVETTLTGSIATVSSNLSAETTARTNADTALQTDINTRATVTYVDTAVTTEQSARASAISTLTARVAGNETSIIKNSRFQEEFSGTAVPPEWTSWNDGQGTFGARTIGDGYQFLLSAGAGVADVGIYQLATVAAGQKFLLSGEIVRESGDITASGVYVSWRDSGFSEISNSNINFSVEADTAGNISSTPDGVTRWEKEVTAPSGAVSCILYAMNHFGSFGSTAAANGIYWRECDLKPVSLAQASVTKFAEAYATNSGSTARLVWTVDTGTNAATIEQTAATGYNDGTWNGSAITLTANEITLDADAINFGAQTEFDTATETFITEVGGIRSRYGTAFGAGASVVMWHGSTGVAQGSESRTNGYLAIGTDGLIYHNAAALSWGATAAEAAASNARVPVGGNGVFNSELTRGTLGFVAGWDGNSGLTINRAFNSANLGNPAWNYLYGQAIGTPAAGTVFDLYATDTQTLAKAKTYGVPVSPGERLYISTRYLAYGGTVSLRLVWLDSSGSTFSETEIATGSGTPGGSESFTTWLRVGGFVTVPSNAVSLAPFLRCVMAGTADPQFAMTQLFIGRVSATQTEPPNYSPGLTDPLADRTADQIARGNTASRPSSPTLHFIYSNTETNVVELWTGSSWVTIATLDTAALKATVSGSYTDIRVGTGTRNTGSITITATGGAGSYTYSHQLIITDNPSAVSVTLNSPTSATFSVSSPSNSPVKLVTFIVISTITDAAGTIFQITRGGALGWES